MAPGTVRQVIAYLDVLQREPNLAARVRRVGELANGAENRTVAAVVSIDIEDATEKKVGPKEAAEPASSGAEPQGR